MPADLRWVSLRSTHPTEDRLAKIETELAVIKWMLGVVIAGVASLMASVGALVFKAFT